MLPTEWFARARELILEMMSQGLVAAERTYEDGRASLLVTELAGSGRRWFVRLTLARPRRVHLIDQVVEVEDLRPPTRPLPGADPITADEILYLRQEGRHIDTMAKLLRFIARAS